MRARAPAADLGLDDREVATRIGVRAADERAADRGEAAGGQPGAEMGGKTAPDEVVEPDPHLVVDRERGRRERVEHRPAPGQHPERPEVAGVRGRAPHR